MLFAENLIEPCVPDIIKFMFDTKDAKVILFSNDTILQQIRDLTENGKALSYSIKYTKLLLQINQCCQFGNIIGVLSIFGISRTYSVDVCTDEMKTMTVKIKVLSQKKLKVQQ